MENNVKSPLKTKDCKTYLKGLQIAGEMKKDGHLGGFKDLRREILITKEEFKKLYGEEL